MVGSHNVIVFIPTCHNGSHVETYRFSSIEYTDSASPGDEYDPIIIDDVIVSNGNETIYYPEFAFNVENISIDNSSRDYDGLINKNWTGRTFDLYFGDKNLPLSSLRYIKKGSIKGIFSADENRIEFEFADDLLLLDVPLQPNEFGPTYTTQGDPWPLTFGNAFTCEGVITTETNVGQTYWDIHTITIRTSDSTTPNVYSDYLLAGGRRIVNGITPVNQNADIQVTEPEAVDGKISVKQYVYHDDVTIYKTGYDNFAINSSPGMQDKEAVTFSGGGTGIITFIDKDGAGMFRFIMTSGTLPADDEVMTGSGAGAWTADVNGAPGQAFIDSHPFFEEELRLDLSDDSHPLDPPENKIQEVVENIAERALDPAQINGSSLITLGLALGSYKSGFFVKTDMTVREAINKCMTLGTGYGFNAPAVDELSFFVLEPPAGSSIYSITNDDLYEFSVHWVHQPVYKIAVLGNKNHQPFTKFFNGSQSGTSVSLQDRQKLRKRFQRRAVREDTTIGDSQIKKRSLVVDTIMNDTQLKLEAEAQRLFDLYSVYRYIYKFVIDLPDFELRVNDTIDITYPGYDLEGGQNCRILRLDKDLTYELMTVYAWR